MHFVFKVMGWKKKNKKKQIQNSPQYFQGIKSSAPYAFNCIPLVIRETIKMWFCFKKKRLEKIPSKWLCRMTASPSELYHCGVTLMGQRPSRRWVQSFHSVPTPTGNHFHSQGSEKKLQLPKMQEVSSAFWKGWGNFVWGKSRAGLADVWGTGQCCGDFGWQSLQGGAVPEKRDAMGWVVLWPVKVILPLC